MLFAPWLKSELKGDVDNAFVQGGRGSWFVEGAREVEETLSLGFLGENLIDRSQLALRILKCCFVEIRRVSSID